MGPDGAWRRIRWDNVARLAALVALGLVVAVWPRLSGSGPRLPPATAVPVNGGPSGGAQQGKPGAATEPRAAAERGAQVEKRAAGERQARAERRARAEQRA